MTLQLPLIPPDVQQWLTAEVPDMTGRHVLVTGANSGIGLEAARLLAARGAHVFMGCRSPERGEAALQALRRCRRQGGDLMVLQCGDCDVRMQMGRDNDVNDIDIGLSDQLPIVRADRDVGAGSSSGCL